MADRIPGNDNLPGNDNGPLPSRVGSRSSAPADHFRRLTIRLVLAAGILAITLALMLKVRVDPQGTFVLDWVLAALLLVSRVWWDRRGHTRVADALGTVAVAALGGMSCGAIAMLELRPHFPLADGMLQSWDQALGIDGIAIVQGLVRQGHWIFAIMAPSYNYTLQIFFGGLVVLALLGNRVEAWRAAFCFVGTLLTTCLIAVLVPAKGLGTWAPSSLLNQLPPRTMRTFSPHFDEFYFGDDPVLRLQVIDGVISFPSFHAVVGFLVLAMWRKNPATLLIAGIWLAFMLLATLPGGGHYVVDLLAGFAVWTAWFAYSQQMLAAA
jgi:membrane-associated phospholipid phosphatase